MAPQLPIIPTKPKDEMLDFLYLGLKNVSADESFLRVNAHCSAKTPNRGLFRRTTQKGEVQACTNS